MPDIIINSEIVEQIHQASDSIETLCLTYGNVLYFKLAIAALAFIAYVELKQYNKESFFKTIGKAILSGVLIYYSTYTLMMTMPQLFGISQKVIQTTIIIGISAISIFVFAQGWKNRKTFNEMLDKLIPDDETKKRNK